ncbi:MAG TPA: type II secretion protein F, partial [Methanomethylovorans sp.]|nr:type II secretion protein F [Methanomethylovorans sp.]
VGVIDLMQSMFASVEMPAGMSMGMVIYTDIGDVEVLSLMVLLIMIAHSLMSALLIRVVDGGHLLSATIDFVIMVWISGITAVITKASIWSLLGMG